MKADLSQKIAIPVAVFCAGVIVGAGLCGLFAPKHHSGMALPSAANLDAAIAQDQQALNKNPDNLDALTDLGLHYYLKGPDSYTESINDLESARDMGTLDTRIFYRLGVMYQSLGLYPFAIENYQRYLRNNPQDEETALVQAKLLYQSGRFQDAVNAYQRLEPKDSKNPVLAENLALSLWKIKQPQAALDELSRMSAFAPEAAGRAAYDSAQIDYDMKGFSDAADNLAKAQSSVGPNSGEVAPEDFYRLLARTNRKLDHPKAALDAWNHVLALDAQDREAVRAAKLLARRLKHD